MLSSSNTVVLLTVALLISHTTAQYYGLGASALGTYGYPYYRSMYNYFPLYGQSKYGGLGYGGLGLYYGYPSLYGPYAYPRLYGSDAPGGNLAGTPANDFGKLGSAASFTEAKLATAVAFMVIPDYICG
ncbi:hypothetical protein Tcan_15812 [Toxocara canis]|uniref:Uncharacterized protein n=1 Tax=Toxocara canis TaxID=6265 RepID=A0A0B2V486_TOXCA|nr:hypothetical protein Tcan_15812 [Toxocara canis]